MASMSPFDPSPMVIGNDILSLGSRKQTRRANGDAPPVDMFGAPGQFDVPNVPDVSSNGMTVHWRAHISLYKQSECA